MFTVWTDHGLFNHSPVESYQGCSQLRLMKNAAAGIPTTHLFWGVCFQTLSALELTVARTRKHTVRPPPPRPNLPKSY